MGFVGCLLFHCCFLVLHGLLCLPFLYPGRAGSGSGRNLWVSGLSSSTRATDLKNLFSKYGKVGSGYVNLTNHFINLKG